MRVAIVGATGFIGKRLSCQLEAAGHKIYAVPRWQDHAARASEDPKPATYSAFRNWLKSEVDAFGAQILVNLAWEGLPNYGLDTTTRNAAFSVAIQEAWASSSCYTYVGFGSCLEYGQTRGALNEDTAATDAAFFGQTKTWIFHHLSACADATEKRYLWIRPFWLYGPGQRSVSLIPSALMLAREGRRISLKTPDASLDFLHIDDLCQVTIKLVEHHSAQGPFNVGSGKATRVGAVADLVHGLASGRDYQQIKLDSNSSGNATWSTNSRMAELFPWRPRHTLEQYIQEITRVGRSW